MRARGQVGLLLAAVVGAVVLLLTLSPLRIDTSSRPMIDRLVLVLHDIGVPRWVGYEELEFLANVLMFLVLGLIVGLVMTRRRWLGALGLCLLSVAIETVQWMFLPDRVADVRDVIANSVGGVIGVLIAHLTKLVRKEREAADEAQN